MSSDTATKEDARKSHSPPPITIPSILTHLGPSSPAEKSNTAPQVSPPLLDPRARLIRPALASRSSAQSARTSSSSVHSIPEDRPLPPALPQAKARRASLLGKQSPIGGASGSGGGPDARRRTGKARHMGRDGYEMGPISSGHKAGESVSGGTVFSAVTTGGGTKEDLAMAKWRKWAVDQPAPTPSSSDTSPFGSRKASVATSTPLQSPPYTFQRTTGSSFSSPSQLPSLASPSSGPSSSQSPRYCPDTPNYREDSSSRSHSASDSGGLGPRGSGPSEIYLTDTVRALQDVELAVDEDAAHRSAAQARQASRLLSNKPRISEIENPFLDISGRLVSRRIRPIVLELIHALGHYIYTLWSLNHPNDPCPWIIPPTENAPPLLRGWGSRTITAVAEGVSQGHAATPSLSTLGFWRTEVQYGLADVNEVVGKWKKRGMVFSGGLEQARYGVVEDNNVLGKGRAMEGGNMARLLNDLEEVLWGDALPRSTDLSYTLPTDFDPYAKPTEAELLAQQAPNSSSGPRDVFELSPSQRSPSGPLSADGRTVMDQIQAMPDLLIPPSPSRSPGSPKDVGEIRQGGNYLTVRGGSPGTAAAAQTNDGIAAAWVQTARASFSAQGRGGAEQGDSGVQGISLSLEEIGRRRHEEWVASQKVQI